MTTHEIINAREASEGEVFLTIRWDDAGHQTTERTSVEVAKALGWQRPDPQPVDPAWMVEVAREAAARKNEADGLAGFARSVRAGDLDRCDEVTTIIAALRLALSRGHVVLAPVMPSEEEMRAGAREDAAQVNERRFPDFAELVRAGDKDGSFEVKAALQARRNVYASLGAVAHPAVSSSPVVPDVDLRAALEEAWTQGYASAGSFLVIAAEGGRGAEPINIANLYANERSDDISTILENLKSGEA